MCTSITFHNGDHFYFGRNLDLEYSFGEKVAILPRAYRLKFCREPDLEHHYAMIGMANVTDGYPLYAEAVNEKGLCMAGLNFPGNAFYGEEAEGKNIAPYEIIPWVLAQCATIDEAERLWQGMHLAGIPFREHLPLAPLHWIVADQKRCVVIEPMKEGVKIMENPVGVLTNNPPLDFHLTNLRQYLNVTAQPPQDRFGGGWSLSPFGQGMGAMGLPGDVSPASRFVRAAFHKANSVCEQEESANVSQFFHILDSVAMVRGSVLTPEGKCDITSYSCCVNAGTGVYYYKTYDNSRISAVNLFHEDLEGEKVTEYDLVKGPQFYEVN